MKIKRKILYADFFFNSNGGIISYLPHFQNFPFNLDVFYRDFNLDENI